MKTPRIWGTYLVRNKLNGKGYVGKGFALKNGDCKRWRDHTKPRSTRRTTINDAIKKHGAENFTFEWLCQFRAEADAYAHERVAIDEHGTLVPNGYNLDRGGRAKNSGGLTKEEPPSQGRMEAVTGVPAEANRRTSEDAAEQSRTTRQPTEQPLVGEGALGRRDEPGVDGQNVRRTEDDITQDDFEGDMMTDKIDWAKQAELREREIEVLKAQLAAAEEQNELLKLELSEVPPVKIYTKLVRDEPAPFGGCLVTHDCLFNIPDELCKDWQQLSDVSSEEKFKELQMAEEVERLKQLGYTNVKASGSVVTYTLPEIRRR